MYKFCKLLLTGLLLVNLLSGVGPARAVQPPEQDAGAQAASQTGVVIQPADYTIQLRSRTFVPAEGQAAMGMRLVQERAAAQARRPSAAVGDGRTHLLVQLHAIPSPAEMARLEGLGLQLLDYIPDHAWLAALDPTQADVLGQDPAVRWAGPLETADKLQAQLFQALPGLAERGTEEVWLMARFFSDQAPQDVQAILDGYGARVVEAAPELQSYTFYLPANQVAGLAADDGLRWLSFGPPDKTTGNNQVRARTGVDTLQAAPYNLTGAGVQVGIWDGGKVYAHTDFTGRLTVVDTAATAQNHATHVAGTVAGSGARSAALGYPANYFKGMAPGAGIVSYDWNTPLADHPIAISAYGVDISQNSWGWGLESSVDCYLLGYYGAYAPEYDALIRASSGRKIPVVFAAGNDRNNATYISWCHPAYNDYGMMPGPGTAKNIITVGATNAGDDSMTSFSNWGPTDDGRLKPEVVAPGCKTSGGINSTLTNNGYGGMCGTSMAAPAVSGILALMIQEYYALYANADPLPSTLKAVLVQTAVDLDNSTSYYNPGPDYASGYGRVDAQAAVDLIAAQKLREDSLSNAESDFFTIDVPAGTSELKISLAWDDRAGAENANPALVNNLDLVLVDPGGFTYLPWVLNPSNPSAAATTGADNRNVVEQVRVSSPAAGTWTVIARGATVPYGPQTYSLAGAVFTPDNPPYTPGSPNPANGATGVSATPTLTWTGGDPDGETPSYDVYVGATNPPTNIYCTSDVTNCPITSPLLNNTLYYWKVVASDLHGAAYGNQASGPVWTFTTLAVPPGSFGKVDPANQVTEVPINPTLSWNTSSGATAYQYCYATTAEDCNANWQPVGGTTATSVALSGLTPNTTYYWQARATNIGGATYANGSLGDFWTFTTLPAPGAFAKSEPGNGAAGVSTSLALSWNASSSAASYQYCYATSAAGCTSWLPVGGTAATSAALSGLTPGTTYYWQVRATNTSDTTFANGSASAHWSFTTAPAPGAFGKSQPANGAAQASINPTLSWGASANTTNYQYCLATSVAGCTSWLPVGGTTSTSAALSGLTPGTTYYWQVRANGAGGATYADGSLGDFWMFTTLPAPGAFAKSEPGNGAAGVSTSPTLSWNASSSAASYQYCYATTAEACDANWLPVGGTTSTSAALSGLTPGTTYYWQVRAANASGTTFANGSASAHWSFTTLPAPGAFTKSGPANGAAGVLRTPTLSWNASSSAASYQYCYATTLDGCTTWLPVGGTSATSVTLGELPAGVTYYWQVRATNASGSTYGDGSPTAHWSFTTGSLPAPGAFTKSLPANGATGVITNPALSWDASANAAGYEYCYATSAAACTNWIATPTTAAPLSGLANHATYYWQVRASGPGGITYANGDAAAHWSFTTVALPLPGAFTLYLPVMAGP